MGIIPKPVIPHELKVFLKQAPKGIAKIWAKYQGRRVQKHLANTRYIEQRDINIEGGPKAKRLSDRVVKKHQEKASSGSDRKGFIRVPGINGFKLRKQKQKQKQLEQKAIKLIEQLNESLVSGTSRQRIATLGKLTKKVHDLCFLEKGKDFGADDFGDVLSSLFGSMTFDQGQIEALKRQINSPEGMMQDLFSVQLASYYQENGEPKTESYHTTVSSSLSHTAKECMIITPLFLQCLSEKVVPDRSAEIMQKFGRMGDPAHSVRQNVFEAMLEIQ